MKVNNFIIPDDDETINDLPMPDRYYDDHEPTEHGDGYQQLLVFDALNDKVDAIANSGMSEGAKFSNNLRALAEFKADWTRRCANVA